jgi:hypothetical protein
MVAGKVMYPLMAATGFLAGNNDWLYPVELDAVSLHINAFAVEGFIDKVLRRQGNYMGTAAMLHFHKGVRLLQERLLGEDDEPKLSDSTRSVVLKLAGAAHFDGDYQAAKQHMEGLRKIVDLRGGMNAFKDSKLLIEMLR